MRSLCRIAARLILMVHILFSVVAMFGGLGLLFGRSWLWLHLPVLVWAVAVHLFGWVCPLTPLEKWLLRTGGRTDYEGGFLINYFGPLLNLESASRKLEIRIGLAILAWNVFIYAVILLSGRTV